MAVRLTLITICWNAASTLPRTIESVLAQSRKPDEYLFVDGGSTDGTLAVIEGFAEQFKTNGIATRVIRQQRKDGEAGIPSAWNQGIAEATGDIIGLINADDWYLPAALERVTAFAKDNPETGLISAPVQFIGAAGEEVKTFYPLCYCALHWRMAVPHPGLFVRKTVYDSIGRYDTRYRISADYDFVWRCSRRSVSIGYLPDACVAMQLGGLANSSRGLARNETLRIAVRHAWWSPIPYLAYFIRLLTGR